MISCDQFIAEFGDFLDGDVASDIRRQLEDHLAHCRTCWVMVDTTRKTLRIITDSSSFDLPEALSEPIVAKVMGRVRNDPHG
jgi:hypothetical protein